MDTLKEITRVLKKKHEESGDNFYTTVAQWLVELLALRKEMAWYRGDISMREYLGPPESDRKPADFDPAGPQHEDVEVEDSWPHARPMPGGARL